MGAPLCGATKKHQWALGRAPLSPHFVGGWGVDTAFCGYQQLMEGPRGCPTRMPPLGRHPRPPTAGFPVGPPPCPGALGEVSEGVPPPPLCGGRFAPHLGSLCEQRLMSCWRHHGPPHCGVALRPRIAGVGALRAPTKGHHKGPQQQAVGANAFKWRPKCMHIYAKCVLWPPSALRFAEGHAKPR
jgi:hypothetical protein